ADVGVAGDVPAVLDVARLPWIGQVPATGQADHRQPAGGAVRHRIAVVVEHRRAVARHLPAGRARTDVGVGGGDEHVQHLGAADAVDQPDAGLVVQFLPDRLG